MKNFLLTLTLFFIGFASMAQFQSGEPVKFYKNSIRPLKDTMTVANTGSDTAFAAPLKKTPKVITFQGNGTKVSGTVNVKVVLEGSANGGKTYVPFDTLSFGNVTGTITVAKSYPGTNFAFTHFRARAYGVTGSMVEKILLWFTAKLEDE